MIPKNGKIYTFTSTFSGQNQDVWLPWQRMIKYENKYYFHGQGVKLDYDDENYENLRHAISNIF